MADGLIAGTYRMQIAFRDSAGYPIGTETDPDNVASGTTTHAYVVPALVEFTGTDTTREVAQSRGDEQIKQRRQMGTSEISDFEVTLAHYDEQFTAYINGSTLDETTNSNYGIVAPNTKKTVLPELVLILSTGFTTAGDNKFLHFVYPNVQIAATGPAATQGGGTNPNNLTYTITPNYSANTGFGFTFANTATDAVDDEGLYVRVRGDTEMGLTTYIDDGVATTFNLGYQPASTTVGDHFFSTNGADGSGSVGTITQSSGEVGWTAGTDGDKVVAFYQTEFVDTV